ncbi:hypothetical protein [Azospirillum sp. ST 5-10]|uniref:hypothetical protein n=1 Tax=unclassified Azospirillum TaxID=2630922 RepID=UPI003F49EA67
MKRARVPGDRIGGAAAGLVPQPGRAVLADIRIEDGAIRAVVPAGGAPCCCRGIDLGGAAVCPLAEDGRIEPGRDADLRIDCPAGQVILRRGKPDGVCALGLECACTPPPDHP